MKKVLVADSGFWIGLLRERDEHHHKSKCIFDKIRKYYDTLLVIPWPTLYEFLKGEEIYLSHRFMEILRQIENNKSRNLKILYYPDDEIRERCLNIYMAKVEDYAKSNRRDRILSLVDITILETIKKLRKEIYPEIYLISYDNLLKSYNKSGNEFKIIEDFCKDGKFI